jgi:hypothetical protein
MTILTRKAIPPNNHTCHPLSEFKKLNAAPVLNDKVRLNPGKIGKA